MNEKKFRILSEEYLLSLLNEAPEDQNQTMQQSDNATYEPREQDASMGTENDMGDGDLDDGMQEMDMGDSGGDDMGGDMGGGAGDQAAGGDPAATPTNVKDVFKKRKLFKDYKDLLEVVDDILETTSKIIAKDLPEDVRKVFTFIRDKMRENREKLIIILTEQYLVLPYQQLLTLFIYLKIATKNYTEMVSKINAILVKSDK